MKCVNRHPSGYDVIVSQTLRPAAWMIDDVDSTDDSRETFAEYAAQHPFIKAVRLDDCFHRRVRHVWSSSDARRTGKL